MDCHGRFCFVMMISATFSSAINHLLSREAWAKDKLLRHAGKIACLDAGVLEVRVKVAPDGMLGAARAADPNNVVIRAQAADLPLIVQNREQAFSYVKVDGDADFANTISQLVQSLQWEIEEDLGKWVGDVAAVRIVTGAKTAVQAARSNQRKLAENLAEYFIEENPMLVRQQSVADFAADVTKLRDDVERLAKRIERLGAGRGR